MEAAEIILRSDHLPLRRSLRKNTLNTKVNNLAVEVPEIKTAQLKDPILLPQEEIKLPLSDEKLQALQAEDKFCFSGKR